jgi:hypothetical protein
VSEETRPSRSLRHDEVKFDGGTLEVCTPASGLALLVINRDGLASMTFEISADTLWDIAELAIQPKGLRLPICKKGKLGTIHAQFAKTQGRINLGFAAVASHQAATIEVDAQKFWNAVFFIKTGQNPDGSWRDKETQAQA